MGYDNMPIGTLSIVCADYLVIKSHRTVEEFRFKPQDNSFAATYKY